MEILLRLRCNFVLDIYNKLSSLLVLLYLCLQRLLDFSLTGWGTGLRNDDFCMN